MTHIRTYVAVTATAAALALGFHSFAQDDLDDLLADLESDTPAAEAAKKGKPAEEPAPAAEEGTVSLRVRVPRGSDVRDDIFFAMAEHRYAVVSMELEQQSLEQVFLTLTEQPSDDEMECRNQNEQEENVQ